MLLGSLPSKQARIIRESSRALGFYMGSGDLESGLHAYMVSSSSTEPFLDPNFFLNYVCPCFISVAVIKYPGEKKCNSEEKGIYFRYNFSEHLITVEKLRQGFHTISKVNGKDK